MLIIDPKDCKMKIQLSFYYSCSLIFGRFGCFGVFLSWALRGVATAGYRIPEGLLRVLCCIIFFDFVAGGVRGVPRSFPFCLSAKGHSLVAGCRPQRAIARRTPRLGFFLWWAVVVCCFVCVLVFGDLL